jgi:hypothetical protein
MDKQRGYSIVRNGNYFIGKVHWDGHTTYTAPCLTYEKARATVRKTYRSYYRTIVVEGGILIVGADRDDAVTLGERSTLLKIEAQVAQTQSGTKETV